MEIIDLVTSYIGGIIVTIFNRIAKTSFKLSYGGDSLVGGVFLFLLVALIYLSYGALSHV